MYQFVPLAIALVNDLREHAQELLCFLAFLAVPIPTGQRMGECIHQHDGFGFI